MRRTSLVVAAALVAMCLLGVNLAEAGAEPWIGSYVLTLPDEEVAQMKELGVEPPSIGFTLKADGIFVWDAGDPGKEGEGHGSYTVEGNTLTLTMKEMGGKAPEGPMAEPMKLEAQDDFKVLSDGHGKFVRKD